MSLDGFKVSNMHVNTYKYSGLMKCNTLLFTRLNQNLMMR